jgi:hypothetical protein
MLASPEQVVVSDMEPVSLDYLYQEAKEYLDFQFKQADALDTKTSIVVGICSLVLATILGNPNLANIISKVNILRIMLLCGGGSISLATLAGVLSFWVYTFKYVPSVEVLYNKYRPGSETYAKSAVLQQLIEACKHNDRTIWRKARLLQVALALLVAGLSLWVAVSMVASF